MKKVSQNTLNKHQANKQGCDCHAQIRAGGRKIHPKGLGAGFLQPDKRAKILEKKSAK